MGTREAYIRYGMTPDEADRLAAVPWPYTMEVAKQIDAERAECALAAGLAEGNRRHEAAVAYASGTHRIADGETRNHASGRPCNPMFCRYEH